MRIFVACYRSFYFMTVLARIIAYLLIVLFILGGIGFAGYMVGICRSAFSKKGSEPLPWWVFWRP